MSKYEPLWKYIQEHQQDEIKLSFDDIQKCLGFPIDHSFLTYKKEVKEYGYEVIKISMKEKFVIWKKESK